MAQRMDYNSATPPGVEALDGVLRLHHAQRLTQGTIRHWARSPATDKQRELLKLAFLDQMSLYEAKCRIAFKFNQSATQDFVLEHAKHRGAT